VRDYSLANTVEIEKLGHYSSHYDLIHFIHDVKTPQGKIVAHCRHPDWSDDDKRFAQRVLDDNYNTTIRHNIDELVAYYKKLGVRDNVLAQLRDKVSEIYKEPSPQEKLVMDIESGVYDE